MLPNVHNPPSYLGYEIQTVSYFDLSPWGWRASAIIRKTGGVRYVVFPCRGSYASESLAMTISAALAQTMINGHRQRGDGFLRALDE